MNIPHNLKRFLIIPNGAKMKKELIAISIISLFIIGAGCVGDQPANDENGPSSGNIKDEVKAAVSNQDSYKFTMKTVNDAEINQKSNQSNVNDLKITTNTTQTHKVSGMKLSIVNDQKVELPEEENQVQTQEIYADGDMVYQNNRGMWMSFNISAAGQGRAEQFWKKSNQMSIFYETVNNTSIEQTTEKEMEGTDYLVIEYSANKTTLWNNVFENSGLRQQMVSREPINPSEDVQSLEVEQWVYKESKKPAKTKATAQIEFTQQTQNQTIEYSMNLRVNSNFEYSDDLSVVIPEEAKNTTQISTQ